LISLSCGRWNRWFNYPTLSSADKAKLVEIVFETIVDSENNFLYEIFPDSIIYVWGYGLEQDHMPDVPGIYLVHLIEVDVEEKVAELDSMKFVAFRFSPDYDETIVNLTIETRYPAEIQKWMYYGKHKLYILRFCFHEKAKNWILDDVEFVEGQIIYQ
jgi:hypothetical protein